MNIAFLTSEYPHQKINHSAGIGSSIKNLATELINQGHKITIFAYSQDSNDIFKDNGIIIHKIKYTRFLVLGWYLYRKQLQNYINKTIKREKIDIIEAPDWTGITAFMKLKCLLVIRLHGSDAYFCNLEGRKQKWKNFWFEKLALKNSDAIVSVSEFAAKVTRSIFKLKVSITIIANGIDLDKFVNNSVLSYEPNTLLYFGTIIRKKGVIELAHIFNELVQLNSNVKLILIGNDSKDILTKSNSTYSIFKKKLSEKAKSRVAYIGKVKYELLHKHIKNAHICIFPSLAETFGMVTIEAMAMQKIVVASNFGWNKNIIDDGINGYLRNPKNHKEFAETLDKLLINNSKSIKIGKAARIKIEQEFDISKIANQNIRYYKSIIKSK